MTRRFLVTGRVQGVGFRAFVARAARDLGVSGWVRNRENGGVEAVASADPDTLASFEAVLRKGPRLSRVDGVEVEAAAEEACGRFEVRP